PESAEWSAIPSRAWRTTGRPHPPHAAGACPLERAQLPRRASGRPEFPHSVTGGAPAGLATQAGWVSRGPLSPVYPGPRGYERLHTAGPTPSPPAAGGRPRAGVAPAGTLAEES